MGVAPLVLTSASAGGSAWEMATRAAHPALVPWVARYCGYVERSVAPVRRLQVPNGSIVLIISFGDPIHVTNGLAAIGVGTEGGRTVKARETSFVAGMSDQPTVTEFVGPQAGVQLDLTPLGARRLLGLPMREVANEIVGLDALGSRRLVGLADRLADRPDWSARFDLLDELLLSWAADGPVVDPAVAWAWSQLDRPDAPATVSSLAREIGWSQRHFVARFRDQIGLPPKPTAQVLRFNRAVTLLGTPPGRPDGRPVSLSISEVAARCGYADHSHLVREFRRLAGCTPSAYLASQHPELNGVVAGN